MVSHIYTKTFTAQTRVALQPQVPLPFSLRNEWNLATYFQVLFSFYGAEETSCMENQNPAPTATGLVKQWLPAHLRIASASSYSTAVKASPLCRNDLKIYQINKTAKCSLLPEEYPKFTRVTRIGFILPNYRHPEYKLIICCLYPQSLL